MPARVVVLGNGVGGTIVANRLARRRGVDVSVFGSHGDHLFQPGFISVPFGGWIPPLACDERSLLRTNVAFHVDRASRIDVSARCVHFESGRRADFDWLVIATGSRMDHGRIPGARDASHHFHCRNAAARLARVLEEFRGGRIVVGAASLPYKCPPSTVEFTLLLDEWLRARGMRAATALTYVYPHAEVLPMEAIARLARPLLEERGVEIRTGFVADRIEANARTIHSNGTSVPFDLLVLVPPHIGAPVVKASGLAEGDGWLPTDAATLRVTDRVYALGDATNLPRPKSGAAAHYQAATVVANVLAEIDGRAPSSRYDGRVMCFLETAGRRASAVESTYERPAEARAPSRFAWLKKRMFSRFYFPLIRRA
jgi:sulfide:quinone oxidoreductase